MRHRCAAATCLSEGFLRRHAAVRFAKPGDRFSYIGDIWRVTHVEHKPRVGQSERGTISMAREVTDPFGKIGLIDHSAWPRDMVRTMRKIP